MIIYWARVNYLHENATERSTNECFVRAVFKQPGKFEANKPVSASPNITHLIVVCISNMANTDRTLLNPSILSALKLDTLPVVLVSKVLTYFIWNMNSIIALWYFPRQVKLPVLGGCFVGFPWMSSLRRQLSQRYGATRLTIITHKKNTSKWVSHLHYNGVQFKLYLKIIAKSLDPMPVIEQSNFSDFTRCSRTWARARQGWYPFMMSFLRWTQDLTRSPTSLWYHYTGLGLIGFASPSSRTHTGLPQDTRNVTRV